ncbi:hypothetical protein CPB83DRAFT_862849 [Crepidotus variabilis]|uniref:Uncharacterized protein n=1 Tax=Crepidotus variabilis TaxID=179855 RepID=A0A9P6E6J6_9AGAR|nr:hypothetical protein CPB83DRAFT_862849 [Crepidotus variabilis]
MRERDSGYHTLASNFKSLEVTFSPQRPNLLEQRTSLSKLPSWLEKVENFKVEFRNILDPRMCWPATTANLHRDLAKLVALSSRLKNLTIVNTWGTPQPLFRWDRSERVSLIKVSPISALNYTSHGNTAYYVSTGPTLPRFHFPYFAGTLAEDASMLIELLHLQSLEMPATLHVSHAVLSFPNGYSNISSKFTAECKSHIQ